MQNNIVLNTSDEVRRNHFFHKGLKNIKVSTFVEILVRVTVIGMLVAVLLPGVRAAEIGTAPQPAQQPNSEKIPPLMVSALEGILRAELVDLCEKMEELRFSESVWTKCVPCKGSGNLSNTGWTNCGACGGAGKWSTKIFGKRIWTKCPTCNGRGKWSYSYSTKCLACSGTGKWSASTDITVRTDAPKQNVRFDCTKAIWESHPNNQWKLVFQFKATVPCSGSIRKINENFKGDLNCVVDAEIAVSLRDAKIIPSASVTNAKVTLSGFTFSGELLKPLNSIVQKKVQAWIDKEIPKYKEKLNAKLTEYGEKNSVDIRKLLKIPE